MQSLAPQRLQSAQERQDERWEGEEKCVDQANAAAEGHKWEPEFWD